MALPPRVGVEPSAADAPLVHWWAPDAGPITVHAVDCAAELVEAAQTWERHAGEIFEWSSAGALVEVRLGASAHRATTTFVTHPGAASPEYSEVLSATVLTLDCDVGLLAHELGHVIGLEHTERAHARMRHAGMGADVSPYELAVARLYARKQ